MAGSYQHVTNAAGEFKGCSLLDNMGDAWEALEECVDMIQWLTGGDMKKVHQAWLEGYAKKRIPKRVAEEPELFGYERFRRDANDDSDSSAGGKHG